MSNNMYYKLFVFAIIMPINGFLISWGGWWVVVGFVLIAMQIPKFLNDNAN